MFTEPSADGVRLDLARMVRRVSSLRRDSHCQFPGGRASDRALVPPARLCYNDSSGANCRREIVKLTLCQVMGGRIPA
jgi:hypothetical protein